MNNKKYIINLETFRDMLHVCPRVPGQSFDELPFEAEILEFLRDDSIFSTIKVAYATGVAAPKPKASARKKRGDSDTSLTPPIETPTSIITAAPVPRLSAAAKGNRPARATTHTEPTDVERTEAEQLRIVLRRSRQETHMSQQRGSGTDEGTGSRPGVPNIPSDDSEEELSWNSSDDEDVDVQDEGDKNDESDDGSDDGNNDDNDETVKDGSERDDDDDDDNDDEEELAKNDDEDTESGKGGDEVSESESEDEGNDEEDQDLRLSEEARIQEEKEADELYRDEQVSCILPRIEESVNATLEAEVLTRSSHSSRTSYAIAADLSEMELKKILIEKMEGNKSIQRSDEQRNLYKALEGPSAGSDQGSKQQREGGEHASASTPSETATGSAGRSTTGSQSRQLSASESAFAEEPMQTTCQMEEPSNLVFETGVEDQPIVQTSQHPEWFSLPRRPPSPDRDWNKTLPAAQRNAQLGIDTLTPELLAGPTYELMRGHSFDPIPQTPEDNEDDDNNEEDQGLRIGEEERMQDEEDAEELYRDVDINQGWGLKVSQETEDSHVILTPTQSDTQQERSSTSSFMTNLLNPITNPADLSEMELKKILIDKMEGNNSIQRLDEQRNPYKALVKAYDADKTILDTYGESTILKEGGEHASASTPSEPATGSIGRSTTGSQSRLLSASESAFAEEPVQPTCQMEEPSHPPSRPPTPDRDWNKYVSAAQGNAQSWITTLAKQTDARSSFNELLDTLIDFSNFITNRLGVDTLTLKLLAGPTYELMRGPLPLIPDNRGHSVIPFEHFINNDLEYLRGGASSHKYTTSVTKTKAADYGHIKWIEDLVPHAMWIQEPMSYDKRIIAVTKLKIVEWHNYKHLDWISVRRDDDKIYKFKEGDLKRLRIQDIEDMMLLLRRIIAVTKLKIVEWHNYKHLDWISVRRDDDKIYKFKDGDFKRLHLQDIEDMLLLLVQGKLSNLTVEEHFAFNVSLRMFTKSIVIQRRVEDLQLGVESYQKRLNLMKPDMYRPDLKRREAYTAYSNPRGFIYQNKDKKDKLMRIDELHKFSDGTLNDVRNALDDRLKGIRMHYFGIVTHWFTLIVLSALRRFDNENMLSLVILILRSILADLQPRSENDPGRLVATSELLTSVSIKNLAPLLRRLLSSVCINKQFFRHDKEDPHAHVRYFNKITSTLKFPNVPNTSIKFMLFSFSLEELHQLDTFYNALNSKDQDSLNSTVGVSTSSSTSGISPDVVELKDMVRSLLLDKKGQSHAPVKAVEESCVTCGGAHSYRNCPATDGNNYRDNIQEFVSQASAVNFNQGNTGHRPPMMSNHIRPPGFPPVPNNQNLQRNNQNRFIPNQNQNLGNNFHQGPVYQPLIFQPLAYRAPSYQALAPQTQGFLKENFSAYVKANYAVMRNMQTQG
nr:hypothetical protein [Tanacetum cinerariifolium]